MNVLSAVFRVTFRVTGLFQKPVRLVGMKSPDQCSQVLGGGAEAPLQGGLIRNFREKA